MLAVRQVIQNSDDCDASRLNFATTNMVLCLFGRRKSVLNPKASAYIHVFLLSVLIAISSGVSDEIIFRGYIPTAISAMTRSLHLALLGQALLFGQWALIWKCATWRKQNKLVSTVFQWNLVRRTLFDNWR